MNQLMQIIALIELSISCAVVGIWILQKFSSNPFPFAIKVFLVLLMGNILFWPFGMNLPLVAYVRGLTGDLSIVLTLLLWSSLLPANKPTPIAFKFSVAIISLCFYPFALGLGMIDPYAWGYGSIAFLIGVLFFALVCGLAGWTKGIWIIAIAILAWTVHWHESANLWDYLLDPFLAIWALFALIGAIYRRRRDKARSGYLFRPG
ncbi:MULTISPECIES: hypothetical protein [unclassified Polynucleobacter]|jgi:hypothetical protein|uniref:hypothetical protein n=2 Tax=Polynucleobacter TaxID=44013 RepID=UPI001BFDE773|nr:MULTISPECIES: hypothetical protein [unclassified Polynucleobacter]MBU3548178.1 hypothetical protein [Polynucleobacter sp. P1-05-14]MEA9601724.1 hypothetical protein [Polynucleobacter sp. MG-28-Ekke-A2]QWD80909.1 hypothetical protein C2755_06425 [Polynucleobacter sp. MWH-S4W17]